MFDSIPQIAVSEFQLSDVAPGTKLRFHLTVDRLPDGALLTFPALVARGMQPGKTLLATGGVHGDEYEGPIAIQDIFEELDVASLQGTFFGIPLVNGPAFVAGTREGGWDHLNLARIFPGCPDGLLSERIAFAFHEHVVGKADMFLDIHSAGNLYAIKEFSGYQVRQGNMGEIQKCAAIACGFDMVWGTSPKPGRSLSSAGDKGVPSIYIEMRGEGRCRSDQLAKTKLVLRNVMGFLGLTDHDFPKEPPRYCLETLGSEAGHLQIDHLSPASGIFVPSIELWDAVEEGQLLGSVRHPDGRVLGEVNAKRAGRVLFLRTVPRVFAGDFIAFVLELPDGVV